MFVLVDESSQYCSASDPVVFTARGGRPLDRSLVARRHLYPLLARLELRRAGYDTLLIAAAMPPEQQLPSMPRGAGQRVGTYSLGGSFTAAPDQNPLQTTPGGDLHIDTD